MSESGPTVGIVVEVVSKRMSLGRIHLPSGWQGHFTNCIYLLKGSLFENIHGLGFRINHEKGMQPENIFYRNWPEIIEVRSIKDNRVLRRNWYLCPGCRRISKESAQVGSGMFCNLCRKVFSCDDNKRACSPFTD